MCGITGFWFRESIPDKDIIDNLISYGEQRGTDGYGCSYWERDNNIITFKSKDTGKASTLLSSLNICEIGSIILCNHRAAPETEMNVNDENKSLQPIVSNGLILVHNGAVSNFITEELKPTASINTDLDSESIIWAYEKFNRNIKQTMEYLSGGFAFLMLDSTKRKLYAVCTHNPLYCGYVRGYGMFWSSLEEGIWDTISHLKGTKIERHNVSVFEDYYCRMVPSNTIEEIDLDSGQINEFKFIPRYVTPNWDPYLNKNSKQESNIVLVAASSGLDSSTTLATLKSAGYKPIAVHFKYGHRGQSAEELGIKYVTSILQVDLRIVDIEHIIKPLDKSGMLTNSDAKITTGTSNGLKTTAAWTTWRNGFFLSHMAAIAESLILEYNYDKIYLTGGFLQLSESGSYLDNSERFLKAFMNFNKFASICGDRIKPMYGLCNLLKTEQYVLLNNLGYLTKLSPYMVSCDRPKVIDGKPHNCMKDGVPACGSGLLSYWASKIANVDDNRNFYDVDDDDYAAYRPSSNLAPKHYTHNDVLKIVDKIEIPEANKKLLKTEL